MSNVKTSKKANSNIVKKENLREVQRDTLERLKNALIKSAGPFGSTTQVIKGNPQKRESALNTEYTKDGHTILSNIKFDMSIEDSLQRELSDITRYIKVHVGDGSTSTVILASLIFDMLLEHINEDIYPPYIIIKAFQEVVEELKDIIRKNGRDLELEDVHKICMICTNSNERVSDIITDIYKDYGLDVFIDVGASTTDHDVIKSYDGLTIEVGYSDPVYINTPAKSPTDEEAGYSIIRNANVYAFSDPIDTMEMHNFFNTIIYKNIMEPYGKYMKTGNNRELKNVKPTVILAPKISLDLNTSFDQIVQFMYKFNQDMSTKPPLLIITNIASVDFEMYSDIWNLCGCKPIKKYIDPQIQEKEQESGDAPTMDNITEFCGFVDEVKADAYKTAFINPRNMFEYYTEDEGEHFAGDVKLDENGERILSEAYKTQIAFLEQQLKVAQDQGQDMDVTGGLKRRINSLKANMVDYYVGGVTTTDRDSIRVLVEDAVKNVRSAAKYGVGYGTNFEGLRAVHELNKEYCEKLKSSDDIKYKIIVLMLEAYEEMSYNLYNTVYYPSIPSEFSDKKDFIKNIDGGLISKSLDEGCPMNFKTGEFDHSVLCTIEQDITILDVLSKIITIIYTTNQCLVQTPAYNMYVDTDDMF